MKPGDKVICVTNYHNNTPNTSINLGQAYRIKAIDAKDNIIVEGVNNLFSKTYFTTTSSGGHMDSIKDYLKEHKNILLTIVFILVLDHLIFKGAFREKVQELIEGLLGKAKKELEGK